MLKTIFTLVVALVLAGVSITSVMGSVYKSKQPQIAAQLWPVNGFALAQQAEVVLASSISALNEKPGYESRSLIQSLSEKAFLNEPFAISSIRNLALESQYQDKKENARKLMRKASELTRRDLVTNIWLIEDYAQLNDTVSSLRYYDQSLRISDEAQDLLIPNLQAGLRSPELINPMFDLLSKRPSWALEFWGEIGRIPSAVVNASKLRRKLGSDYENPTVTDQFLITSLLRENHFEEAERLYFSLIGKSKDSGSGIVRNSGFSVLPKFSPFEWQLFFGDQHEAGIEADKGVLNVSTFADGGGIVAKQLIKLDDGNYIVKADQPEYQPENSDALYLELYCAERKNGKLNAIKVNLDKQQIRSKFRNDDAECLYFWLDVSVRPRPDQRDFEASISRLAIERQEG